VPTIQHRFRRRLPATRLPVAYTAFRTPTPPSLTLLLDTLELQIHDVLPTFCSGGGQTTRCSRPECRGRCFRD